MFVAATEPSTYILGGVLVVAILRAITSDLVWRGVIKEVREELNDCREGREEQRRVHSEERTQWRGEKVELETKVRNLEGEVVSLRRTIHEDHWLGIDPASRKPD